MEENNKIFIYTDNSGITKITVASRWQQREGSKWVYVYFSNETKANYLMQIADALKVNIKIEAI